MAELTKIVIPVAGLGTRVLPASKVIPKEMLTVVDKPVIQYVIEEAVAAGFREIILVTHGFATPRLIGHPREGLPSIASFVLERREAPLGGVSASTLLKHDGVAFFGDQSCEESARVCAISGRKRSPDEDRRYAVRPHRHGTDHGGRQADAVGERQPVGRRLADEAPLR